MIDLQNKSPKILVVGDLIVDQYLWGSCKRVSPEAPVQVIDIDRQSKVLGGAGNVVNNLKKLGAKVDVISVLGNCSVSSELRSLLEDINVSTNYLITQNNRISSKKTRIIASQQQVVRYDHESSDEIDLDSQNSVIKTFNKIVMNYEVILVSDYGKGILTNYLTQSLINSAKKYNKKVLIDPKGSNYSKYKGAYLLTPNIKEASLATNINIEDDASLLDAIRKLKSMCNLDLSVITLSENGIAIFDHELQTHPTFAKEVFDVTGAGDTVLASLGFSLSIQNNIDVAVKFANLASGVVVGKIGSATATLEEIKNYELSLNKSLENNHIKTINEITLIVKKLKDKNKKIVFTNGCFDVLHIGHVKYLEKARSFGDVLIIGLNSNKSIRGLKGDNRPINTQDDRAYILASMKCVDYVVIFNEPTPIELIKIVEPDVLVKGSDYEGKEVVGQEIAKELKLVEFIEGKSTTKIIEKLKKL